MKVYLGGIFCILLLLSCESITASEKSEVMSDAECDKGDLELARSYILQSIEAGVNPRNMFKLALIDKQLGDFDSALIEIEAAIELDSSIAINFELKGEVLAEMGDYDRAITALDKSLEIELSGGGYASRAKTHKLFGNAESAILDFERAIEFDSTNVDRHQEFGQFYYDEGQFELAINEFNKSIFYLDSSLFEIKYIQSLFVIRGLCHVEVGSINEACEDFEKGKDFNDQFYQKMTSKYCL